MDVLEGFSKQLSKGTLRYLELCRPEEIICGCQPINQDNSADNWWRLVGKAKVQEFKAPIEIVLSRDGHRYRFSIPTPPEQSANRRRKPLTVCPKSLEERNLDLGIFRERIGSVMREWIVGMWGHDW
jgi:hypothetical protein